MSFLDRLLGRDAETPQGQDAYDRGQRQPSRSAMTDDERAIERYRYLLRTAPPDQIEQAHAEAFEQLTAEQRRQVLEGLAQEAPEEARTASDDPRSLARLATRAEMRNPGTLERTWGGMGRGGRAGGLGGGMPGFGTFFLASLAGTVVGSAVAQSFFADSAADPAADATAADAGDVGAADQPADAADAGWGGEEAAYEGAGADFGPDAGGDFGDFGGGDF